MRLQQIEPEKWKTTGLLLICLTILLNGCTVEPDYKSPAPGNILQDGWEAGKSERFDDRQPLTSWWQQFHDEQLGALIERLFSSSLALEQARQRIVEVNARHGVIAADKQMQLAAALGYTHAETGDETVSLQRLPPGKSVDVYSVGVTAGWELDLWGRTSRLLEAAEQDIRAGYADYQAMQVSLAAELTLAYIDARTLEARLKTLHKNVDLQLKTLELAQSRYQAGNGTALSVARTERLIASTRARIPEIERRIRVAKNRITVLLGLPPRQEVLHSGSMPEVPDLIGIGLPADLLTRRPDLRLGFHRYHAAVARIGAAEALAYPTLSLSGSLTLSSDTIGKTLGTDALMYTLGPGLSFPLFTGHRIESTVAVRNSQAAQARLALEQKIVEALAEVENAGEGVVRSQQRTASLEKAEKSALKSVELSDSLYEAGLVDFSEVLDNQQELVALQDSLLLARQQALSEVVRLYRALGGGWMPDNQDHEQSGAQL